MKIIGTFNKKIEKWIFDESKGKLNLFFSYTIVFFITAILCFSWFIITKKTFIWEKDGWTEHYKALIYYSRYLRDIVRSILFDHKVIIPEWDFYMSEGSDILTALHYYVIGDPFSLLSVFIPTKYMFLYYQLTCILRLFLAGVSFITLCLETGKKNRLAILSGAISYVFSFWGINCVVRHPFFLNPMIYFPLVILGIERIINRKKSWLLTIMVFVSAVSNFYFFYMITVLAFFYVILRLICLYSTDIKQIIINIVRIGFSAFTGLCLAGFIFLPVLIIFTQDSRISSYGQPFHLLYPLSFYSSIPGIIIGDSYSSGYWLCLGLSIPVILSIVHIFVNKRSLFLRRLTLSCIIIIIFPVFGRLLNGMSYMSNRWSWACVLLCSYILVYEWEYLIQINNEEWNVLFLFCIVFCVTCFIFDKSRILDVISLLPLFFVSLIVIKLCRIHEKQFILLIVCIACIINNAYWKYSPSGKNFADECLSFSYIKGGLKDTEVVSIKNTFNNNYIRYSGHDLTRNINCISKISNTQYYWSLTNPYVNAFRSIMEITEKITKYNAYEGYDDRTTLLALAGVQVFSTKGKDKIGCIPYGYKQIGETEKSTTGYDIYKNSYSLPIGYSYDSYFTKNSWDHMDAVQKQEAQLESVFLNREIEEKCSEIKLDNMDEKSADYSVAYKLSSKENVITKNNCIVTTKKDSKIAIIPNTEIKNAELYVEFKNLRFEPSSEFDLFFGDDSVDPLNIYNEEKWRVLKPEKKISIIKEKLYWDPVVKTDIAAKIIGGINKTTTYLPPDSPFSTGRGDYIINLGFVDSLTEDVVICFQRHGIYSFDCIKLYAVPMGGFENKIQKLKKDSLKNISILNNSLIGEMSVEKSKILCIAVPYSPGWKGYIDDSNVPLYVANGHYIGMVIPKGKHEIRISYSLPYAKEGIMLSLIGALIVCLVLICSAKTSFSKYDKSTRER